VTWETWGVPLVAVAAVLVWPVSAVLLWKWAKWLERR
jgi:hypothetical protein